MKFAHIADVHLGGCRNHKLQELNLNAFKRTIEICKENKVDFILIAGDLFDTPMPSFDILKETVSCLKELKENNIECYIIPGSHDFSPSGKTFIDVLEKAGLCTNIAKFKEGQDNITLEFFVNDKLVITGLPGRKSNLEQRMFNNLIIPHDLGSYKGKLKIFMLHTTLQDSVKKEITFIESVNIEDLPAGFDYYAAGHIHNTIKIEKDNKIIVYPGPIFPNNFSELEELKEGSFLIVELDNITKKFKITQKKIKLKDVVSLKINVSKMTSEEATSKIIDEISKHDIKDKILLLRIHGCIEGKLSNINFNLVEEKAKDCYVMLKNIHELTSSELKLDEIKSEGKSIEEIEKEIIERYRNEIKDSEIFQGYIEKLMTVLDTEKKEGETTSVFESRIFDEIIKILNLEDVLYLEGKNEREI